MRRIVLTVPNFMLALAIVAKTDLITALPRWFAALHAARFGILSFDAPLSLPGFRVNAIVPKGGCGPGGSSTCLQSRCPQRQSIFRKGELLWWLGSTVNQALCERTVFDVPRI